MEYRRITKENRNQINRFIAEQWISTEMVIRGKIVDMTAVVGLAVMKACIGVCHSNLLVLIECPS